MIVYLILFAFVGQICCQCPKKEDLKPCICKKAPTSENPSVTCEGLTSAAQLTKPMSYLRDLKLTSLDIEKSNIGRLPPEIFQDIEIESLTIAFSNLTALGQFHKPPFMGLERSLKELEIRESFLDERYPLSTLSLSHLKKLNTLIIESNLLPVIGNDWFESGPYDLKRLFLMDVYTEKLGDYAFSTLSKLTKFSLTGAKVTTLKRSMFSVSNPSLEALDFSDNQLTSLPVDLFHGMPSLTEVYLDNNGLKTIDEATWAPVWGQLDHVHLTGNSLTCDKNIQWIYMYRLPEVLMGTCAGPETLKSRNLTSLTLRDFQ